MGLRYFFILILSMVFFSSICLGEALYPFTDEPQQELFIEVTKELRCVVCSNQSLYDSLSPMAIDLKQILYEEVKLGKSKKDLLTLMSERYGEQILYTPTFSNASLFLWLGPVLMLFVAFGFVFFYIKRKG